MASDLRVDDPFFFEVSNDGLTLTCVYFAPDDRVLRTSFTWETLALAEENREGTMDDFRAKAGEMTQKQAVGTRARVFRLGGPFVFGILAGPPTWWLPRVSLRKDKAMVGWLRRAYVLYWKGGG